MAAIVEQMEWVHLRAMFYMVTPNETSFQHLSQVPNYVDKSVPFFIILIVLEAIVRKIQGEELPRLNDGINSISHGILSQMHSLIMRPVELVTYVWVYNNFRLVDLPWDSPWVWFLAFILQDFTYYWFHRFSHECNIIWASHQVHHSSEDYNLSTALRQSAVQKYYSMIMNLGMAFFLPPPVFYVHLQFNLLYQFWIHTEVVSTIGPLEYILNTPSHHRVHHGRNPYCIDKNYGGSLIIWDRMFNTFQAEGEKVVYGLVHPNQWWSPLYGQVQHFLWVFGQVRTHKGISNKLSAVIKGPGWQPGLPWAGLLSDIPEIEDNVQKYDSSLPFWASVYVGTHFFLINIGYSLIAPFKQELTALYALACIVFFIMSITSFGALFDHSKYAATYEFLRCVLFMVYCYYLRGADLFQADFLTGLFIFYGASAILWLTLTCFQYRFQVITKKNK